LNSRNFYHLDQICEDTKVTCSILDCYRFNNLLVALRSNLASNSLHVTQNHGECVRSGSPFITYTDGDRDICGRIILKLNLEKFSKNVDWNEQAQDTVQ